MRKGVGTPGAARCDCNPKLRGLPLAWKESDLLAIHPLRARRNPGLKSETWATQSRSGCLPLHSIELLLIQHCAGNLC